MARPSGGPIPYVIPSSQKPLLVGESETVLVNGASFETDLTLSEGYGTLKVLAISDVAGVVDVIEYAYDEEDANDDGTVTQSRATAADSDGNQVSSGDYPISGRYIQVRFRNTSGSNQARFKFVAYLIPINSFGGVFDDEGRLIVVGGDVAPGETITSPADTSIGAGTTQSLPAVPANTRRMTVQNTGPAGSLVRIREMGGTAGTGIILPRFGIKEYGGADGALERLEAQDVSNPAVGTVTVAVQFEGD